MVKLSKRCKTYLKINLLITFPLLFGLFLIVFSIFPALYGYEEECTDLRQITLFGGCWYFFSCLCIGIDLCFNACTCLVKCIWSMKFLFDVGIMIGIWVYLDKDEDCGALTTLVWVLTWIIIAMAALLVIIIFCISFDWFGFMKEDDENNEDEENERTNEQYKPMIYYKKK